MSFVRGTWKWTALALLASACASSRGLGDSETFASPQAAVDALIASLRPYDEASLRRVLGQDGPEVFSSGDEVADSTARETFLAEYDQRHEIRVDDDSATLVVGPEDWPMPIPLVHTDDGWEFDLESGDEEILARRIGKNELAAIETCLAIVDAQHEFAALTMDGTLEYAQKFKSDPGKKNGLYWEVPDGDKPSPLGPLVAEAVAAGYPSAGTKGQVERPYHGYCFRMLTAKGDSAPGGAKSYIVNGRMTGGFGVVAYPAKYANSGVMTFLVDLSGVVYQKDLGDETEKIAGSMKAFDPGEGWTVVP